MVKNWIYFATISSCDKDEQQHLQPGLILKNVKNHFKEQKNIFVPFVIQKNIYFLLK